MHKELMSARVTARPTSAHRIALGRLQRLLLAVRGKERLARRALPGVATMGVTIGVATMGVTIGAAVGQMERPVPRRLLVAC